MQLEWQTLTSIIGVLTVLIGVATVYLRLFMSVEIAKASDAILKSIELRFTQKEIVELKISEHDRRIARLEKRVNKDE